MLLSMIYLHGFSINSLLLTIIIHKLHQLQPAPAAFTLFIARYT